MFGLAVLLAIACNPFTAAAMDSSRLARIFVRAERENGIPRNLLAAIAYQESSLHPWSINLAGRGFHPETKISALVQVRNSDVESFDLGLMQINSMWLYRLGLSVEDALEPVINVNLGSMILQDCLDRYGGDILSSLACYHSGEVDADGRSYARQVVEKWRSLQ